VYRYSRTSGTSDSGRFVVIIRTMLSTAELGCMRSRRRRFAPSLGPAGVWLGLRAGARSRATPQRPVRTSVDHHGSAPSQLTRLLGAVIRLSSELRRRLAGFGRGCPRTRGTRSRDPDWLWPRPRRDRAPRSEDRGCRSLGLMRVGRTVGGKARVCCGSAPGVPAPNGLFGRWRRRSAAGGQPCGDGHRADAHSLHMAAGSGEEQREPVRQALPGGEWPDDPHPAHRSGPLQQKVGGSNPPECAALRQRRTSPDLE
jgi:hypothetical protein